MKLHEGIDSKFRFVILASKRAKQLLGGSKPKIKSKSKNPIRIAQDEVRMGLVDYEITEQTKEEVHKLGGEDFIGEEIIKEGNEIEEASVKQAVKKKKKTDSKKKKKNKK